MVRFTRWRVTVPKILPGLIPDSPRVSGYLPVQPRHCSVSSRQRRTGVNRHQLSGETMRKIIAGLAAVAAFGVVGLSNYHHPQANGVSPHPGANGVVAVAVSNF